MPDAEEEDMNNDGDGLNAAIPQPPLDMPRAGLAFRDHFAATHFRYVTFCFKYLHL